MKSRPGPKSWAPALRGRSAWAAGRPAVTHLAVLCGDIDVGGGGRRPGGWTGENRPGARSGGSRRGGRRSVSGRARALGDTSSVRARWGRRATSPAGSMRGNRPRSKSWGIHGETANSVVDLPRGISRARPAYLRGCLRGHVRLPDRQGRTHDQKSKNRRRKIWSGLGKTPIHRGLVSGQEQQVHHPLELLLAEFVPRLFGLEQPGDQRPAR